MKIKHQLNIKKDLHFFIFSQLNELRHWDLTTSDVKILSAFYNLDFEMKSTGSIQKYEDRMSILFSMDTKNQIMKELNMSYNTFNNSLTKLRKKDKISKNNTIDERWLFDLNRENFMFTIEFENNET